LTRPFIAKQLPFFLTAPAPCPYLPGRMERKVFTKLDLVDGPGLNDTLTHAGFRRSQSILYRPACDRRSACKSARIVASEFKPSRTQRRIMNRNADLLRLPRPAEATPEQYALLSRYLDARHGDGDMAGMDFFDFAGMVEDGAQRTEMGEYRDGAGGLVAAVLIGGIKRLANVAGKLVPFMATLYLMAGFSLLAMHLPAIPAAFALIFESAFTGTAATGGFAGASIMMAIQFGVARGVFSNEAGLGSAPIAHAAAKTDSPVRQGMVAMLGTFMDTLVVCSVTGLAIVVTGVWQSGEEGATLSQAAFASSIPFGDHLIALCLALFAFTTLLGWSYYGERCAQYLLGERVVVPFRVLWVLAIPLGANMSLGLVWVLADILNGLMALPNLIALLALSGLVVRLTRDYVKSH